MPYSAIRLRPLNAQPELAAGASPRALAPVAMLLQGGLLRCGTEHGFTEAG